MNSAWPAGVIFQDPSKIRFSETKTVFDFWATKAETNPRFLTWHAWYDRGADGKEAQVRKEGLYAAASRDSADVLDGTTLKRDKKKPKKKTVNGGGGPEPHHHNPSQLHHPTQSSKSFTAPTATGKARMLPAYSDEDDSEALLQLEQSEGDDSERDWDDYSEADLRDRVRHLSPAEVATSPKARVAFLRELSTNNVYQDAVSHVSQIRDDTVGNLGYITIPAIPWATWARKEREFKYYNDNSNKVSDAIQWLSDRRFLEDDHYLNRFGELEQVVFVAGMLLREMEKHQFPHSPSQDVSSAETLFNSSLSFMEVENTLETALQAVVKCNPPPIKRRVGRSGAQHDYAAIHDGRVAGFSDAVSDEEFDDASRKPGNVSNVDSFYIP